MDDRKRTAASPGATHAHASLFIRAASKQPADEQYWNTAVRSHNRLSLDVKAANDELSDQMTVWDLTVRYDSDRFVRPLGGRL